MESITVNEPRCPKCGTSYRYFKVCARYNHALTEDQKWEEWTECGNCGTIINEDEMEER